MHDPEPEPDCAADSTLIHNDSDAASPHKGATAGSVDVPAAPAAGMTSSAAAGEEQGMPTPTPHGPLQLPAGALPLQLRYHAAFLMAVIKKGIPEAYDSNRLTMLHFAVAGLDLLGQRELLEPYR